MSRAAQLSFNAGVFGKRMYARSDLGRYRFACRQMENFIPTVQGPAVKRSGTRFVKLAKGSGGQQSRLIPFEFSRDQAYVLEFADNAIRFMRDSGAVLETAVSISPGTPPTIAANCVITTDVAHNYATGDEVYISGSSLAMLNDQFFTITVTAATTFTIGRSTTGESLIAAGVTNTVARTYQITNGVSSNSIPWNYNELDSIQFAQDADVMYLVHPSYAPHKLARTSDTSWTCREIDYVWPPFRDENVTDTTLYATSATSATSTIEASTDVFTASMIGGYVQLSEIVESIHPKWQPDSAMGVEFLGGVIVNDRVRYEKNVYVLSATFGPSPRTGTIPPVHEEGTELDRAFDQIAFEWTYVNRGMGFGKIETFTDANTVVVDVLNEGFEYPLSVVGTPPATKKWAISAFNVEYGYPAAVAIFESRLWFGGTQKDPQTFWGSRTNRYEDFQVRDGDSDSSVLFTLASNKINAIQWMTGHDALTIGTTGGEFTAESGSLEEGITPDNIKVKQMSAFGSATDVAPVFVDSALIMAHRNGRRINEMVFNEQNQSYTGVDLTTVYAEVLYDGVRGLTYQASPFRQVYAHSNLGNLHAFTYNREEAATGWSTITLGAPVEALVESVCVIPHPNGASDQVWLEVLRATGGGTRRSIEYIEEQFDSPNEIGSSFFLDCGSTYVGAATTTLTGFLHLTGTTLTYFLTGNSEVGTAIVSSKGTLTVPSTTSCSVGFPVVAKLETMDFDLTKVPFGTTQGDLTRVVTTAFRLADTGTGLTFSNSADSSQFDAFTQTVPLYDGLTPQLSVPGSSARGTARVAVKHATPLPCTISAIIPTITGEK